MVGIIKDKQVVDGGSLSAKVLERRKTSAQRAEDIAYTINHSLYCTLTDFINPPINAATDNWLRWLIPGCGHDHSGEAAVHVHSAACGHEPVHVHGPGCGHAPVHEALGQHMKAEAPGKVSLPGPHVHGPGCGHHKRKLIPFADEVEEVAAPVCKKAEAPVGKAVPCGHFHAPAQATRWEKVKLATRHAFSRERFMQYAKGEFIGDFGAVPITVGMQRYMPGVMVVLRRISEPVMRPIFRWGIDKDSRVWAKRHYIEVGSEEYKKHVAEVYEHEMKHFPQAIVWTGASLGLNVGWQMHEDRTPMPFMKKALLKSTSVLSGVLVTAAVVVAARAFAPHKVRSFDQWTSRNFILPSTKVVGKIFGVDEESVERMAKTQEMLEGEWAQRVTAANMEHDEGA